VNYSILSKPQSGSVVCYCVSSKRHLELDAFGKTQAPSDISEPEGGLPGFQLPLQKGTAQPRGSHICVRDAPGPCGWQQALLRRESRACHLGHLPLWSGGDRWTKMALGICCQCAWILGSPSGLLLATVFPHYFSPGRKRMHFS